VWFDVATLCTAEKPGKVRTCTWEVMGMVESIGWGALKKATAATVVDEIAISDPNV
jgi:uncharacterized protein (UPF0147 family)